MGSSSDLLRERSQSNGAADSLQITHRQKLLGNGKQVQRHMLIDQTDHSLVDHTMLRIIEARRRQFLHRFVNAARLYEQGSQDSFLEIKSLRRAVPHLKPYCIKVHFLTLFSGSLLVRH